MHALAWLIAATLFVAPGAWIAFTVCDAATTTWRARWALAAMLSPATFAVQVVALAACGVSFAKAVPILATLNLGALALPFLPRARREPSFAQTSPWITLATWLGLIAPIALCWMRWPDYRQYGWHNAMNTAMCYRIAELPAAPEDPDLAGIRMNYGWLGHVQSTSVGWLADVAPTLVFPWLNALMLFAALVLMEATMLQLRPRHPTAATLTSALVLAGTMITGLVTRELMPAVDPSRFISGLPGDMRAAPLLTKFHNFDAMVIGIAGLAALVHFVVVGWTARAPRTWALLALVAVAIGLSYPILFPFAAVVLAIVFLATFTRRGDAQESSLHGRRWHFAIACALAGACVFAYLQFIGRDRRASFIERFQWAEVANAAITMVHVLGLWTWIAWPSLRDAWRTRRAPQFQLSLCLLVLIAVALVLQMKGRTQYKVYFVQALVIAPLCLARIDGWFARRRVLAFAAVAASVLAMSVLSAKWIHDTSPQRPRARSVRLGESAFAIRSPAEPAYAWIDVVRERTPSDAIVVAPPGDLPLAVLTGRSQYLSMQASDERVLGYSLGMHLLFENKGYSTATVMKRYRTLETCFRGDSGDTPPGFAKLTAHLRSLGRPIVIAFPPGDSAYHRWLESRQLGEDIHRDDAAIVRLLLP